MPSMLAKVNNILLSVNQKIESLMVKWIDTLFQSGVLWKKNGNEA